MSVVSINIVHAHIDVLMRFTEDSDSPYNLNSQKNGSIIKNNIKCCYIKITYLIIVTWYY